MFLLGLSSSFIPYLLLSIATMICYVHDHQETIAKQKPPLTSLSTQKSDLNQSDQLLHYSQQSIQQVQTIEPPLHFKEISAISVPYTGLPVSIITSQHLLRAPPGIKGIYPLNFSSLLL